MKMQGVAAEHAFPPSKDFNPDVMGVQNWAKRRPICLPISRPSASATATSRRRTVEEMNSITAARGIDPRSLPPKPRDIYVGDLHIDSIRVKTRDFS
jgi:hypothetical protein